MVKKTNKKYYDPWLEYLKKSKENKKDIDMRYPYKPDLSLSKKRNDEILDFINNNNRFPKPKPEPKSFRSTKPYLRKPIGNILNKEIKSKRIVRQADCENNAGLLRLFNFKSNNRNI